MNKNGLFVALVFYGVVWCGLFVLIAVFLLKIGICLSKIHYLCFSPRILKWEKKAYGKTKKTISVG